MARSGQIGMPLVVDVDGTLIKSNLLVESALKLVKQSPLAIIWAMIEAGNAVVRIIADRPVVSSCLSTMS